LETQASSFYRFFCCPSYFPSPFATNFAFCTTFSVGWLSENITACTKAEGTAPLRVGSDLVRVFSEKNAQ